MISGSSHHPPSSYNHWCNFNKALSIFSPQITQRKQSQTSRCLILFLDDSFQPIVWYLPTYSTILEEYSLHDDSVMLITSSSTFHPALEYTYSITIPVFGITFYRHVSQIFHENRHPLSTYRFSFSLAAQLFPSNSLFSAKICSHLPYRWYIYHHVVISAVFWFAFLLTSVVKSDYCSCSRIGLPLWHQLICMRLTAVSAFRETTGLSISTEN